MPYSHHGEPDSGTLERGERTCRKCGQRKSITEFHWAGKYRHRTCKVCQHARQKELYEEDKERISLRNRARYYARKYGLSLHDYEARMEAQGRRCAICLSSLDKVAPHVDHDHNAGYVRSILCVNCNLGIGNFKDSPGLLQRAAIYVEEHRRING